MSDLERAEVFLIGQGGVEKHGRAVLVRGGELLLDEEELSI